MTEPTFTPEDEDRLAVYANKAFLNYKEMDNYTALQAKKKLYDEYMANLPEHRLKNINKRVEEQRAFVEKLKKDLEFAETVFARLCGEQVEAEEALEKHNAYEKAKAEKIKALVDEEAAVEAQLAAIRKRKEDLSRDVTPVNLGEGL